MKATLIRETYSKFQTRGKLTIVNDDGKTIFECDTLELPWKENRNRISCIPEGEYKAVFRNFGNYANRSFHIQTKDGKEVPGRSSILIHSGNFFTDTRGCILVGKSFADIALKTKKRIIEKDGILDILNSRKTVDELLKIGDSFFIDVKSANTKEPVPIIEEEDFEEIIKEIGPLKVGDTATVNVKSSLNLRDKPAKEGNVIDQLLNNQKVKILEDHDEWLKIIVEIDIEGWVSSDYVHEQDGKFFVKTKGSNLNIRKEPKVGDNKVVPNGVPNGTELLIKEQSEKWMKVSVVGKEGFVYQDYLKK
ncbi:DUF5675 family protein [Flammeovirga sp. SJP92]|uniref:DUF5675 family protein n=1 Tax=Flammeovirga sp. SJP92 TaxID=1775430 RepID=UPI000787D625|nr:DUF5675 family protein [Flammeovirga sp. SJP92]KXX69982.1 hypothetical protein AVL50_13985 [Flammeovirga sp. SJP92]